MSRAYPIEFLRALPKTDLHVHLDGSLRIPTLVELAGADAVKLPSYEESGLREQVFKDRYADLPEYLAGFRYTTAVMQRAEHLERIAFELAEDNIREGVRCLEVRFAPQLHIHDDLSMKQVLGAVADGLERAAQQHNHTPAVRDENDLPFEYGIIVCALRSFNADMSRYYHKLYEVLGYADRRRVFAVASNELARGAVHLMRKEGLPIVGFDLAGEEAGYPAHYHEEAFRYAHRSFLRKTVHAGEAYGPESIFMAITRCHANRIGHGTFLFDHGRIVDPDIEDPEAYVRNLAEYIADQRITIEVNLTSNLQTTPSIQSVAEHPLRTMLEKNLAVSLCTDNRLVSNTTVTREIELAVEQLPIDLATLKKIIIAGFKGSFFHRGYREKRAFVRAAIRRFDQVARQFDLDVNTEKPQEKTP